MYLFFDTETTGTPRNYQAPLADLSNWPRVVQIAWLQFDKPGNLLAAKEYLIKPEGFTIPAAAVRIHGITTKRANAEGVSLGDALSEFSAAVTSATVIVAHNMNFDEKIVGAEFLRAKKANILENKRRICTMRVSTNVCRLPGRYGYKWPSLAELHRSLFAKNFEETHNARTDVEACAKCFFELLRRGVIS